MKVNKIHKPVLIVIAGPNGSGKTSVTSKLLHHEWMEDAIYINPDIVAQEKFGDWNSPTAVMQSVKYCEALREKCLHDKHSLIFETVLSRDDKVDFIRRAHELGFFVRLFFVCTKNPQINASRIAKRVMEGGHDVPIAKIISRYEKSLVNCRKAALFADKTYLYDNSIDDHEVVPLYRMNFGKLAKMYEENLPKWAKVILDVSSCAKGES